MGPKERREREREEIRGLILDAARDLFATEGFEAVTMRRIAERIEYSPTAIYFHFKDKEALLKELCEHDFAALAAEFAMMERLDDPIAKLRATGMAYVKFGINFPNHYRLMFMTPHPPVEPDQLRKGNPEEDAYAFLKQIVSECLAQGRMRPQHTEVEMIAQTVWGGVHGVISLEIAKCNDAWVDWQPILERAETMIDILVQGLTGETPSREAKE